MKMAQYFHRLLVTLYTTFNAIMIYLFLLNLPFGYEPFAATLMHWEKIEGIGSVATTGIVLAIAGLLIAAQLGAEWKNALSYFSIKLSHPACSVFMTTRRQPFDTAAVLKHYPAVKEAAFAADVQFQVWESIYRKHAENPLIMSTRAYWHLLRDLYVLSVFYLAIFLVIWALKWGVPFVIASPYLFVFGAQTLFLLLSVRKIGYRFVDNVLATDMGLKPGETAEPKKGRR